MCIYDNAFVNMHWLMKLWFIKASQHLLIKLVCVSLERDVLTTGRFTQLLHFKTLQPNILAMKNPRTDILMFSVVCSIL